MWEKVERLKLELKVEEERAEEAEEGREAAERQVGSLQRRLEEERVRRGEEVERARRGEEVEVDRPLSRVGALEAECGALRTSLLDIQTMVEEVEGEERRRGEVEGEQRRSRPRPVVPARSALTPR